MSLLLYCKLHDFILRRRWLGATYRETLQMGIMDSYLAWSWARPLSVFSGPAKMDHHNTRSQRKSTGTRAAGGAAPATTATFQLRSQSRDTSDLLEHFGLFAAGLCTARPCSGTYHTAYLGSSTLGTYLPACTAACRLPTANLGGASRLIQPLGTPSPGLGSFSSFPVSQY